MCICKESCRDDSVQQNRYDCVCVFMCVCVCVCERERERERRCILTQRMRKLMYYQMRKTQHITRWEEGALYSHPLSSLSTRHINMGNEEAHKLCVIEYDSMTHTKC